MGLNRRNFIEATGAAALTGLAGCAGDDSNPLNQEQTDTQTPTETTSEQNEPAQIEFLESHGIQILPILNEENIDNQAGISLEVEDQNGLQNIEVLYNNSHRNEPLSLYDRSRHEFEQGVDGEMVPIQEEFPQRMIAPNTGEFTVEVTDVNGNTETRQQQIHNLNQSWKVDRPRGSYSTERNWDNLRFDRQEFHDEYISEWHKEAVYHTVLRELENNNQEKYSASAAGSAYSNSKYEIGGVDGAGYWDKEFYNELTSLEHILGDAQNALKTHQSEAHGNAASAWNNRFSATLEEIVHEFNGQAKEHLEETGEKAVHAGYVNEGGHGTVITYTDLQNTDIEAEQPWQFVDTTDDTVAPVTQNVNTRGTYNPFVDGYSSDEQLGEYDATENPDESETLYGNEKGRATMTLVNFVRNGGRDHADIDEELEGIATGISDTILEDIFNEHVPSGGSINPVLDMVEKSIDLKQDTGKHVQVYGEDLENYEMAVTENDELYQISMDPETTVGEEEVEAVLETA